MIKLEFQDATYKEWPKIFYVSFKFQIIGNRENVHIKLQYQPRSHGPYHYRQSQKQNKDRKPETRSAQYVGEGVGRSLTYSNHTIKRQYVSMETHNDNEWWWWYVLVNGRHVNGVVGNTDKTREDHRCNPVDVGRTEGSPSKTKKTDCLKRRD